MEIPLPNGDTWPEKRMHLPSSKVDDTRGSADAKSPGYKNMNTAWWDSSMIYGSSEVRTEELRRQDPTGKLPMKANLCEQFLFRDKQGNPDTGFNDNWWIGMELLHTLFALEHNSICDMLRKNYPSMTGDEIFDKARLINCALMAKIHTVEWTPGILAHPTLQLAMNANWWGLAGEKLTKMVGRLSKTSETLSGIPGSGVDHQGVPYSLTEEFVSVYRLHTLCPDTIAFFDSKTGAHKETVKTEDTLFQKSQNVLNNGVSFADAFYSFGINYPGAITNHNYPNFLRNLTTPDGIRKDLGTIDILRDRERGVPRYCEFRRLLRMPVPKTFSELTGGDEKLAADLSDAYDGKIEMVDAIIGSHSEPLPQGFGFSDMAFRIFILMASRRLKSDRFIAGQWNNETYTKEGMAWVQNMGMKDVLIRHFPELQASLKDVKNPFGPWDKLSKTHEYHGIETNAPKKP